MASIVAYIETREETPTAASRFVLAQARRLADAVGATVYALLTLGPTKPEGLEFVAGKVGVAGADRVLCCADEALAGPPLDATHGALLAKVAERLRPNLFLFPAGEAGHELGRPLAVRLAAAFLPFASIRLSPATESSPIAPLVCSWRADFSGKNVVNLRKISHQVIATLMAGEAPPVLGEPAMDIELLSYAAPTRPGPRVLSSEPDPSTAVAQAQRLLLLETKVEGDTQRALEASVPAGIPVLGPDDPRRQALATACPAALLLAAPSGSKRWSLPGLAPDGLVAMLAPRVTVRDFALSNVSARPESDMPLGGLLATFAKKPERNAP
jgi:hypothetical protein